MVVSDLVINIVQLSKLLFAGDACCNTSLGLCRSERGKQAEKSLQLNWHAACRCQVLHGDAAAFGAHHFTWVQETCVHFYSTECIHIVYSI